MLAEQLPIAAFVRRAELYLLREAPSAKDGGVNAAEVVGGSDQEDVVLRFQLTDRAARLLYQLDIVLRLKAVVAGQQAIYLVYENDRRAVFFRSGK